MQSVVHTLWYGDGRWHWLLLPLEVLFWLVTGIRRTLYRLGVFPSVASDVPVVVVGNITAGGTGKTPVTLWLAELLKTKGFHPGIVSRGYGGRGRAARVQADSSVAVVGDEPLLLARRSGCPVVVDADRVAAARALVAAGVDVIIADDGLQHYRLRRDYEICVVDGARGLGNGHRIPAGPLREGRARLATVDQVLVNGTSLPNDLTISGAMFFQLVMRDAIRVNGSEVRALASFVGMRVNAAAAIGHPQRFFTALRAIGIEIVEHAYPDHASIAVEEFDPDVPLLLTEKDAVKLSADAPANVWYVPVDLQIDNQSGRELAENLVSKLQSTAHV